MIRPVLPRGILLSLIALLVAASLATGATTARAANGPPIVVGTTISVTGAYAEDAKYALQGYQLFIKEQNAKGGWLGREIQLKYYDDQSEPSTAVSLYQKLIQQDHVDMIVGPYSSAITAAVANIADQYKMPMISPEVAATAPFKRGLKWVFQGQTQSTRQVIGSLEIGKLYGYKRLAVTGEDTSLPRAVLASLPDMAKSANMDVVYQQLYQHNATDYAATALAIKQSNPDVLMGVSYSPDSIGLLQALKQVNFAPKLMFFAIGPTEPSFLTDVGKDANGVMSMATWNASIKTTGNDTFNQSFQSTFHTAPDYHSAMNYAALQVLTAAINDAKALDNEKIRNYLATQQVQTVAGTYQVDSSGVQIGYEAVILQWQDGKQYVVWPQRFAQRKPLLPFPKW